MMLAAGCDALLVAVSLPVSIHCVANHDRLPYAGGAMYNQLPYESLHMAL